VVTKNEEDKVEIVDKIEKPTQHGGWAGMAVGAAMGLIFPPGILVGGLLGAGTGALIVVGEATDRAKRDLKKEIRADAREMERAVDEA